MQLSWRLLSNWVLSWFGLKSYHVFAGKKVSVEMKRIMGPSPTTLRYSLDSHSLVSSGSSVGLKVTRRPKRKSKMKIDDGKQGILKKKVSSVTFQKKIIVFDYMGRNPPKIFARSEKNICLSGLLPSLSVEATETTIRKEICDVLNSCSSPNLSHMQPNDFEFVSMSGKQGCIPQCKSGFEWNGRAVKELAGSGCVYVRLTKDYPSHSDDDDDGLPPGPLAASVSTSHAPIICATEMDTNSSVEAPQPPVINVSSDEEPIAITTTMGSTDAANVEPTIHVADSEPCSSSGKSLPNYSHSFENDYPKLQDIFPNMSKDQLQFVYELCMSFDHAVDVLLGGPSLNSLRGLTVNFNTEGCPKIRLDSSDDDNDWMEAALAFYKCKTFDKKASVRIAIHGQPAVDTGGIRRQFFCVVFQKLSSETVGVFDGLPNRLRPAYKASTLASGILSTIGTMIAHSFLLDGQGFPYMAEYCYYYIAGCFDLALSSVTIDDTSLNVKAIINQVTLMIFVMYLCILFTLAVFGHQFY